MKTRKVLIATLTLTAILIGLGAFTVVPAAAETVGSNLIKNGGFENVTGMQPSEWTVVPMVVSSEAENYHIVGTGAQSGDNAYFMGSEDGVTSRRIHMYQELPQLKAGKSYVFQGWIKVTTGGGIRAFIGKGSGAAPLEAVATNAAMTTITGTSAEWKRFTYRLDYTDGDMLVMLQLLYGVGTVYWDNLSLYELKHTPLLTDAGEFEALNAALSPIDNVQSWRSDNYTLEGTHYDIVQEDGISMVELYGVSSGAVKGITFPFNAQYNALQDGTPIKLTFRVKLTKAASPDDELYPTAGSNYNLTLFHSGGVYDRLLLPKTKAGEWVNVEYWFKKFSGTITLRQYMNANADILIDGVSMYAQNEPAVSAGKTLVTWDQPSGSVSNGNFLRVSLPSDSYDWDETISPYIVFPTNSVAAEECEAITAIYSTSGGEYNLENVVSQPLTAVNTKWHCGALSLSTEDIIYDSEKNYTVQTYIWNGLDKLKPLAKTTIVPLIKTP